VAIKVNGNPKVSIILPTYNGSRYIRESIASCLNQTYRNIELIIVDDCSMDATPQIVRSLKDSRIKYIRNEKNQRLPRSLNIGFAAATGDYLTWTSDDNQFLPDALEKMLGCLQKNRDVDFVYADYYGVYLETGKKELRTLPDYPDLGRKNCIGACFLYTRKVYATLGGYDPKYELVEDYEYWIRIANNFNVLHYPQPLYLYGEHANSLKSTRQISIVLFDTILRYRYGYIPLAQIGQAIRLFSVGVFRSGLSGKEYCQLWIKTFRSVFRLSRGLGITFSILVICVFWLQLIRSLLKPFRVVYHKISQDLKFKLRSSHLRSSAAEKNVLCVVPYLVIGGAEQVVLNIIRGLTPAGYTFHLLAVRRQNNQWCRNFSSHFKNVVLLDDARDEERYYSYLKAAVQKLNIQTLLLSNASVAYNLLPRLRVEFKRLKIIDVLHAEGWAGTSDKYLGVSAYLDQRVCISRRLKEYMAGKYKESRFDAGLEKRLVTIHNGIDVQEFRRNRSHEGAFKANHHIADGVKIISFVGRLAPEKNPFLFVEIARKLLATAPHEKFKFVMVGDGSDFDLVRERIKKAGLENHFILTGMLDNVVELLTDTWVLLVVSKSEGIPFVILEALSMDVPVISTDVGAIHEAVTDGFNGYLIKLDGDVVEKFVRRIVHLSTQENDHQSVAGRARESVLSEFSIEHMAQGYRGMLEETLPGKTVDFEQPFV
jgi:glycosyltransferase involved in cell wall biosynthesis/GT2 family glycosyltransferase